jgi:tetratricopeptide (TPR) repeat protein
MAQMLADAGSVIEPCTRLLADKTLSKDKRGGALLIRGRGYHRSKRPELAARDYAEGVKATPNNVEIWLSWSNVELRRRDWDGYVQKVERAAKIAPDNPRVIRAVGGLYWNAGNRDGAITLYTKALELDPNEAFARLFRSQSYQAMDKFAEAIADADALVAMPRDVINRDGYLDEHGEVRDFHVMALIHRGELFQAVGDRERAARDFEAAVAAGRSAPALKALADLLLDKSDVSPEAIALLQEAAEKEPLNASVQFQLGLAHTHAKQYEPAYAAFDRAIAARPHFAMAFKMRARMHRAFGRTDEAVKDFVSAIQADPDIVEQSLPALQYAGYWTSRKPPTSFTPEFMDAIRACMIDPTCH